MTCADVLRRWDGDYEGYCQRPADHDGPHWDGLTAWRDEPDGCVSIDLDEDRGLFVSHGPVGDVAARCSP